MFTAKLWYRDIYSDVKVVVVVGFGVVVRGGEGGDSGSGGVRGGGRGGGAVGGEGCSVGGIGGGGGAWWLL